MEVQGSSLSNMFEGCCFLLGFPADPKAWDRVSSLAEAYRVGKAEAGAALNLCQNIDEQISARLHSLVKWRAPNVCHPL